MALFLCHIIYLIFVLSLFFEEIICCNIWVFQYVIPCFHLSLKMRFLYLLLIYPMFLTGQSLEGTNGLFKIPSAIIAPDGFSYIGASFYPKGYYELYGTAQEFDGMPTFITLSLYDRVEFMFRYTHQLGQEVNPVTKYFPDRMFTLRYNVVRESERYPALTIGLHDVSEALGGTSATPWFLATYLVATKSYDLNQFVFTPTVGYAYDLIDPNRIQAQVFNGFFGGVEFSLKSVSNLSFISEYDSEGINVAFKTTFLNHIHFSLGLLDLKSPAGFVTYRFNLSNR